MKIKLCFITLKIQEQLFQLLLKPELALDSAVNHAFSTPRDRRCISAILTFIPLCEFMQPFPMLT